MHRAVLLFTLCTLAAGATSGAATAAIGDLDLISRADGPDGVKGNLASVSPALSADGRVVAFDSVASNLVSGTTPGLDVFTRDAQAGTTTLVSRADGAAGSAADGFSTDAGISADGRFVSFVSNAENLHADDPDSGFDVFVRDLESHANTLVSRAPGASGEKGNGESGTSFGYSAISPDGRHVAFTSEATNLHPDDTDADADAYVRGLDSNTTTLVSRATGADGDPADGASHDVAISADGRFVAFASDAANLHPDDTDTNTDVFVRDVEEDDTTLVSRATGAGGVKGNGNVSSARSITISSDGQYVAFSSVASNLHPDDTDGIEDVFVRDRATDTTTLVSRATGAAGAKGDATSLFPRVSADGRFVAFASSATTLHPDDSDGRFDVFVRDLRNHTTTLASRAAGAAGEKSNGESSANLAISGNGRYVAFASSGSNLHPQDTDAIIDVFRRDVLGPPPVEPAPPPAQGAAPPLQPAAVPRPGCALTVAAIAATSGDDERDGTPQDDVIFGLAGDDLLRGLAGADCLYGHEGADRLRGGSGRDRVFGGVGADRLRGGKGGDRMRGRGDDDRIRGGKGDDRIDPGTGSDTVLAGRGNDRVNARGTVADTIDCGRGRDVAIVDELDSARRCERVRVG